MQNFNHDNFRKAKLPNEAEIMAGWQGDLDQPVVSVICTTYNHQNYIEDAIRGFLIQKTDFPFEVIIHDDASTDDTQKIIRRYADRYPRLIKPVLQTENQQSQGKKVSRLALQHCRARIIAFCEGDDFWIDSGKLAIQAGLMIANPQVAIVVHPCLTFDGESFQSSYTKGNEAHDFDAQDILNVAAQFSPTASYMVRCEVYDVLPAWLDSAPVGDFFMEMYSLKLGTGRYIPNVMSVYRVMSAGSWMDRRRRAKGDDLIDYGNKMYACFSRMQEDKAFSKLNFNIKKSAIHLELATGYLLNNDSKKFRNHITRSHRLYPDSSLIQKVFLALRWFPFTALMLFKAKRKYNLLFKIG